MKVVELITKSNWGGAQRHVYDVSSYLNKKGYEITVALGGNGILKDRLIEAKIQTVSIESLGRDIKITGEIKSFWKIFGVIRKEKPDILHLHSPKAAGLGALAGRLLGIDMIVQTIHGWSFNEDRSLIERSLILFFSWITTMLCHKTIVISEHDYAQSMYFPLVRNKIQLIPIGIESPVFMSVDGAKQLLSKKVNMDLSLFKKKTVMGTISELHNNKGLHYLVESMESVVKKHKDAIMVVIGEGEQRESLTEHIKKSGLEKNFFLVGYIDHANEYLKALDIFVFPSIKEGLPYALLEAGMASLPVISTTVGGIPDIIEDMKTGILIQPKNTRDLTHAISFMLEHPKDIKRYGKSLKEQVSTKFSSIKMLENIDKLFSEAYKPKNQ